MAVTAGTNRFEHLFSPLAIGSTTVKNRIFSSGHDTVLAQDGRVTDALVAYHEARARGGVGHIVTQVAGVHETARYTSHVLMTTSDDCIPGFRRLADAVHAHGCAVFGQLFHPGREIMETDDGTTPVAYAPSAVPTERFRVTPRVLDEQTIVEIIDGYATAAARLERAGYDGAEIVASHGYLPAQFLNPLTNLRDDAWGGDPERRLRFLRSVLAAVRDVVSPSFVVGLRISIDERSFDGMGREDALWACTVLSGVARPDYFSVVAGSSATHAGSDHIAPPMTEQNGYTAPLAAALRAVVDVPVFVAGRINQPQDAELILARGQADACAMTRALIADPELPNKAMTGRLDDIRACVGCNQACIGHFHRGYPISCIQHPETGRELTFGPRARTRRPRRVMVVGGGPAGLKAAAVAAEAGHDVALFEAASRVGGQVRLAERLPGRAEFGGVAINLEREARLAGARLITGTAVDAAAVRSDRPDVVILATGARAHRPPLDVAGTLPVFSAWDVVTDVDMLPRGRVVVADSQGDWTGLGIARAIAAARRRVTLCTTGYAAGERLQQYVRDAELAGAARAHVTVVPLLRVYGVDDDTAYFQHTLTGEPVMLDQAAALVLAQGAAPVDDLARELTGSGVALLVAGDCVAPRTVEEAVLDGLRAGLAVDTVAGGAAPDREPVATAR
jgi:2,4-dienoyl-CoA reductase-like NADH-dependent reductase (Old Yellow Enzyme family)